MYLIGDCDEEGLRYEFIRTFMMMVVLLMLVMLLLPMEVQSYDTDTIQTALRRPQTTS